MSSARTILRCCPQGEERQRAGHLRWSESYGGWVMPLSLPASYRYPTENVRVSYCPWCGGRLDTDGAASARR